MITFSSQKKRQGKIATTHGDIIFPAFMPDATYGHIQYLDWTDVANAGVRELVMTTLHLEQQLGNDYLARAGGIHKFSGWTRPILTDSGGFQIFSLIHRNPNKHNKITDAGCSFIDYATGDYNFLSPETSQIIQHNVGSDIRVVLDEPVMGNASIAAIRQSVKRTTEWARRSKAKFLELNGLTDADFDNPRVKRPLLTAVIQGANRLEYREQSLNELVEIGFDIYGLGGMPLRTVKTWDLADKGGFHKELLQFLAERIPADKIRYGLGVGTPDDLVFAHSVGWDIFDTVLPTRNARHGYLYVHKGEGDTEDKHSHYDVLHIKNTRYAHSDASIDSKCSCSTCKTTSREYLRYLIKNKMGTGMRLATIHNLHFYAETMTGLRALALS